MPASDNDPLELVMTTRVKGATGVRDAEKAVKDYGGAEDKAARTARTATGVYERLAQARKMLDDAYSGKASVSPDRLRDIELDFKRRQQTVDRLSRPDATRGSLTAKAFLTSRFGKGNGLMPLVGQGLDAIGGEGTAKGVGQLVAGIVDGPLGKVGGVMLAVVKAGAEAVKFLYQMADASARTTQRFTDLRGEIGGSSRDAGNSILMSRITGVDGGSAAKVFQEKITSDPLAMGVAGGMGIRNTRAPFGSLAFGGNYQQAIERTASIQDADQRRRTAMILGIEQEVNRYSKLSSGTKSLLGSDAATTAKINNPEAERATAEFTSAQQRFSQAKDNFMTTLGKGPMTELTIVLNSISGVLESGASGLDSLSGFTQNTPFMLLYKHFHPRYGKENAAIDAGGASGGGGSALSTNNSLLAQNNQHLERLNGTIGGGDRAQNARPSALQGANLNRAITLQGLRLGSL